MSFLTHNDAAKISVLSKRFRSVWTSFPVIFFDEITMGFGAQKSPAKIRKLKFLSYVSEFLLRRNPKISLDRFTLCVTLDAATDDDVNKLMDGAINFVIQNTVKELDLDVAGKQINTRNLGYSLPLGLFSVKSITVLKLKGVKINCEDLILSFPFIEDLSLGKCSGMSTLKVSCEKLKSAEVDLCSGLKKVEIDASDIESFSYIDATITPWELEPIEISIAAYKSLKHLSLKNALINDEWLQSEVPKFRLLEDLNLEGCKALKILIVSGDNLKTMLVKGCTGLEKIKVAALDLESFSCMGSLMSTIDIKACKSLKNITLEKVGITDRWLESNVAEFPFLQNLQLAGCTKLKNFSIFHNQLKSFQLSECLELEDVQIEARSLASFAYSGGVKPSRVLVDSTTHLNAKLSLHEDPISTECFSRLRDFLSSFGHSKELQLVCNEKLLIVPENLRDSLISPLYDLRRLKVQMWSKSEKLTELMDSLLWLAPRLDVMSVVLGSKEQFLKAYKVLAALLKASHNGEVWANEMMILCEFFKKNAMRLEAIYDKEKKPLAE